MPNVRRAQFKNLPLACSYRAQIRFIAESATNAIGRRFSRDASTWKVVVLEPPIETDASFEITSNFCNFQKRSSAFLTILSKLGGSQLDNYYFVPGILTRCSFNDNCNVIADDHV